MIHGPQLAVVLKVGKRALTNGNGSQAGDDHAELAVDRAGPKKVWHEWSKQGYSSREVFTPPDPLSLLNRIWR